MKLLDINSNVNRKALPKPASTNKPTTKPNFQPKHIERIENEDDSHNTESEKGEC
jgi:hypothetical protein